MVFRERATVYLFSILNMRKFIVKALFFSLPIAFLFVFTFVFYTTEKGDLIRIGYIINKGDYRSIFKKELVQKNFYTNVSSLNFDQQKKFTVLSIGDSFSGQKGYGYKNYLAQKPNISVLHLDRFLTNNPIETAYGILNGDMLDKIKVDYIILQSVERHITRRVKKINKNRIITIDSLKIQIKENEDKLKKEIEKESFPSQRIIKFPLQNLLYFFDDDAYGSDAYQVTTDEFLFSNDNNRLLFLSSDLKAVKENNNVKSLAKLNTTLNELSNRLGKKGIKLIVLPSPDKYDFYYDHIINTKKYPKPLFFERFQKYPKEYIYINSKKILKQHEKHQKDLYFYDDTHWSPWSSKILANEIEKVISFKK